MGVLTDQLRVIEKPFAILQEILNNGQEEIQHAKKFGEIVDHSIIELLSPVTSDSNIYCQGANYGLHRLEAVLSVEKPPYNLMFMKASSTLTSAKADIVCPNNVRLLDYEIELGLIIKKDITEPIKVTDANLADYIAGFVITNDVSARDIQMCEQQWFKGKSYRGFCPTGPYIYLLENDEIKYIYQLEMNLEVNGKIRQTVKTDQMLYRPTETLTEMSEIFDLKTGDLVMTGTPSGVALNLKQEVEEIMSDSSISYQEKLELFHASQKENGCLEVGDCLHLSIKSIDGKIDLGEQRNKII